MYIVVNKTTRGNNRYKGEFPLDEIETLLENGDDVIIISLYSNTIKIPFIGKTNNYGLTKSGYDWEFKEYPLPYECQNNT
jgi:hypothetical protein